MSDEFEQQLALENAEKERQQSVSKVTEDFLAAYQANYGTTDEAPPEGSGDASSSSQKPPVPEKSASGSNYSAVDPKQTKSGKAKPSEPSWFELDDAHNTWAYVSNLPDDIDEEEFLELMSKCGLLMKDEKGHYKIELYHMREGELKGDALCCYIKVA
ncbi:hypothetical protein V5799_029813 [Amblyomma americanum]|uniref:Uncharacterized protein n=1 Tax=Amblyomma americanum TaxID=6943 RepID=A0AAQ4EQ02_AMBAM